MISRYIFVCLYFFSFFLINRWYDFYQYYFHRSTQTLFSRQIIPINQLNVRQLQYILNLRGITYVNINEKYDLIKMVEQTGFVRESELYEPIEDHTKRQTTMFSSYKQLLDFVDDCKDTIWFIHLVPDEEYRHSLIRLPSHKWQMIERRLSIFNIQTGRLNCSSTKYSNLCRISTSERFILFIPSLNHRSTNIYSYELYSTEHYDYQYVLKWLSKTSENHVKKNFDWYQLPRDQRSLFEFQINSHSYIPIYYFTLFYRYDSTVKFRLNSHENEDFQIKFSFRNSTYIYNDMNNFNNFPELYSFRSLNIFLSCLTINIQTLMYIYFIILNIYFLYDIYLVQSLSLLKKILMINMISGFFWSLSLPYISRGIIDYMLQMISFYFIKYSQNSQILMLIRNDLFLYSIMSKWILYPTLILLHIGIGLAFRWYLKGKFGRLTNDIIALTTLVLCIIDLSLHLMTDILSSIVFVTLATSSVLRTRPRFFIYNIPNDVIMIDQTHALCSKVWQFVLCLLFSDQGPNEGSNNALLQYLSQDSLWLGQRLSLTINPNVTTSIRSTIDLTRLATWRFTIRKRKLTHGANEYYSDIELEQSDSINEQNSRVKKSFVRRRITNLVSLTQQDNCYTSESDENNNSVNSPVNTMNSSQIYQCAICLEKYINHVYICTLPCLHHFHRKCLFDWLCNSEHHTCPLCRSPVLNE